MKLTTEGQAALLKLLHSLQSAQDAYNSLSNSDEFLCVTVGGYEGQIETAKQLYTELVGALPNGPEMDAKSSVTREQFVSRASDKAGEA